MVDKEIGLAEENLEEAYSELEDLMDKDNAIFRFGLAWEHAQRAISLHEDAIDDDTQDVCLVNMSEISEEPELVDPDPDPSLGNLSESNISQTPLEGT